MNTQNNIIITALLIAIFAIGLLLSVGPAYAIAALPDFTNNNNEDDNSNASTQEQTQARTTNGYSTYQNDMFGFTIQYPSDWRVDELNSQQPSYRDPNNQNPFLNVNRSSFIEYHSLADADALSSHGFVLARFKFKFLL